jgi:hypothetical protein
MTTFCNNWKAIANEWITGELLNCKAEEGKEFLNSSFTSYLNSSLF